MTKQLTESQATELVAERDVKWMPINTAEKEHGKKILCYGEGYIFEAECEFDDGYGWWCNLGGAEATHWMPLPSPPTIEEN